MLNFNKLYFLETYWTSVSTEKQLSYFPKMLYFCLISITPRTSDLVTTGSFNLNETRLLM